MAHTMVFIGGLHRSGTSLLAHCLGRHPLVSAFHDTGVPEDEGQHLQSVYPAANVHGGPGRFAFSAEAHLTESAALARPPAAAVLFGEWSRYWDLSKPFLLEKSPPNLIRARFLQALFPESRFVMTVRHPLIVALATQRWKGNLALRDLIEHWFTAHDTFAKDAPHIRRLRVVRYEQLMAAPEAALERVTSLIGLPAPLPASDVDTSRSDPYRAQWSGLSRSARDSLRRRFEAQANEYGYSLIDLDRCDPVFEAWS